jgi:hypothetical protein
VRTDAELAADAKRFAIEISIGAVRWDDDQSFEIRDLLYALSERLESRAVVPDREAIAKAIHETGDSHDKDGRCLGPTADEWERAEAVIAALSRGEGK